MRTENQIEMSFIEKLKDLKYTYRDDIRDKASLEANFREKFEKLNKVHLSDSEFDRLKESIITADVFDAAKILRETNTFKRDDDTPLQYTIVNTTDWCKNDFEVVNQLRINTDNSNHRYDVILLINGVPVVQIELKALQVTPRRAMEQIVEYKNDPGNGYTNSLLCFMQLFIVSNESNTYYFANNSKEHFCFNADERFLPIYQLADEDNKKITHLHDFSQMLLRKCALGQLISKYMVLVASEKKLMIMRPYQIYAVRAIMDCIEQNRGNGYIWHTTGSGKTMTSFKSAQLIASSKDADKVIFLMDRIELGTQSLKEYRGFAAESEEVQATENTGALVSKLKSPDPANTLIVTSIQKMSNIKDEADGGLKAADLEIMNTKRIVFIVDECHRSTFGDMLLTIKQTFPRAVFL